VLWIPFGGIAYLAYGKGRERRRQSPILSVVRNSLSGMSDAVGTTAPPEFAVSETPTYLGRAVAALATDPDVSRFAGQTLASWTLMHEYGFTDVDGTRPDFGRWITEVRHADIDPASTDPGRFR